MGRVLVGPDSAPLFPGFCSASVPRCLAAPSELPPTSRARFETPTRSWEGRQDPLPPLPRGAASPPRQAEPVRTLRAGQGGSPPTALADPVRFPLRPATALPPQPSSRAPGGAGFAGSTRRLRRGLPRQPSGDPGARSVACGSPPSPACLPPAPQSRGSLPPACSLHSPVSPNI